MGILERFKDIMNANINALLDKCEDPEKMIDQTLRKLHEDLAELTTETASVNADLKNANRKVEEREAEIEKFKKSAENALREGQDDDARLILEKKQKAEATLENLKKTQASAKANSEKMTAIHAKLTQDIEDLEMRKDDIKATVRAAKTQQKVNSIVGGTIKSEASVSAFDRMEAKAQKMLDQAEAQAELIANTKKTDDLVEKYSSGSKASVDDEMAQMKAKLGL